MCCKHEAVTEGWSVLSSRLGTCRLHGRFAVWCLVARYNGGLALCSAWHRLATPHWYIQWLGIGMEISGFLVVGFCVFFCRLMSVCDIIVCWVQAHGLSSVVVWNKEVVAANERKKK